MPTNQDTDSTKLITGYCEPWSLRAGEEIEWFGSSHIPTSGTLGIVRLDCGDPTRTGPGFAEAQVEAIETQTVDLSSQRLLPGSYAEAIVSTPETKLLELSLWFQPTFLKRDGVLFSVSSGESFVEGGNSGTELVARFCEVEAVVRDRPLERHRWYFLSLKVDVQAGVAEIEISSPKSASPARDLLQSGQDKCVVPISITFAGDLTLRLAAGVADGRWDGRIAAPKLVADGNHYEWEFEGDMEDAAITSVSGGAKLNLFQLPTRGVTGPTWSGEHQRWRDDPKQWNAIHFHHDDLYDAGWETTGKFRLPADLSSGIYCLRFESELGTDRVPFFVRPGHGLPTSDVALLMPTCTYMAYANHRMLIEGADFVGARANLRPEHQYLVDHPEVGLSHYERHPDGSGVMFSSRRRPVLQVRPGADGWNFTPDTDIHAFLLQSDADHDVISDDDVHFEGYEALAPYRVIVTGSHPEYWSTKMLDALDEWQRNGGRLMYLGGNGFYWRVSFSDSWPGAIELRRAEDGVRNWQTGDGENYHAWGGEYGGLWRRNGRAPNQLVGIGFAAQGFEKATFYQVNEEARDSRASWILAGIEDDVIGTSGLGGGAAGQEVDRYDERLGSPSHAVVIASATEFGTDMLRTKEEFEGTVAFPVPDPYVRSDIVFFEAPNGGAVFSVGSISWFGALARNNYDNDVAQMTQNVLERFLDPEPFEL